MSDPRSVIAALRDGKGLTVPDAQGFIRGLVDGRISDSQAAAFAMAVLLRGTGDAGRVALTLAMRDSGRVMHWGLPGPVLDKHSTGGIGDCTSLIVAPVLAACGAYVPMISGRGLGHTGGTLDKLEAIPGYCTEVGPDELAAVVAETGAAIVAASADLAPADRRLYAIRDEAAAVESLDLITASILSKKLAAGLGALVLDVKCGSGAFLKTPEQAQALARAMVTTANDAGCRTAALITDMDQPLARAAGNAVEVATSVDVLAGRAGGALRELSLALAAQALELVGRDDAAQAVERALDSGAAAERFARMVARLGGPSDLVEAPGRHLPRAPVILPVSAPAGHVARIDGTAIGQAVVALGAGRVRAGDPVDPAVGLTQLCRLGDATGPDAPLALVHARTEDEADRAITAILAAVEIGDAPQSPPLIRERILP